MHACAKCEYTRFVYQPRGAARRLMQQEKHVRLGGGVAHLAGKKHGGSNLPPLVSLSLRRVECICTSL